MVRPPFQTSCSGLAPEDRAGPPRWLGYEVGGDQKVTPGMWGIIAALCWGLADFVTRFTGRAVGHVNALFGMLLVTSCVLTAWAWISPSHLRWDESGLWLLGVAGAGTLVATLFLYQGLARGPVTIVAPIVAAYPALVVVLAVLRGAQLTAVQWVLILATMVGAAVVARSAGAFEAPGVHDRRELRLTVLIAAGSAVLFAVAISAGQSAAPIYGSMQTVWLPRLLALAGTIPLYLLTRDRPRLPVKWWPALSLQGALDAGGYLAIFRGSMGTGGEIAAVTASGYAIVTVLLARTFLSEAIGLHQWFGIILVTGGVVALAG